MRIIIAFLLCLSTSGCVFFIGRIGAIGFGKKSLEYYDDGKIKKETIESKSLLADIFNLGIFNK